MRPLAATELLHVWEEGSVETAVRRALRLLAAASPDATLESLSSLTIGERDRRLLALREWTFGSRFVAAVRCPACGERLETIFDADDLRRPGRIERTAPESMDPAVLARDGYEVRFRLVTSADIESVAGLDVSSAAPALLDRCIDAASYEGQGVAVDGLPPGILATVAKEIAGRDPDADIEVSLSCASCAHGWQTVFDIGSYFWSELDAWARRLLGDVHTLAAAYGWSEAEILGLSALRRQCYLQMVLG